MKANWVFWRRYCSGRIHFEDGREVFLQGEDAANLDDELDKCDTDDQMQVILDSYEYIAVHSEA